jgi:Holliday junction resolvase RusA-like endonuclease
MILFQCKLPFPVSVNQMYGGGGGQQRFKTKKYKAWLESCQKLEQMRIGEPVTVEYIFTWPCNRARDGQNYMKGVLDYLVNSEVLVDDDWKIVTKELWRHLGVNKECASVEVVIRQAKPDNPLLQ